MQHYYSNPQDKQGHETKWQKVRAWRTTRAALSQQTLQLSFHSTTSSALCWRVWKGLYLLDSVIAHWPAAKARFVFLTQPGQRDLTAQVETFSHPPSPKWGCLCSLEKQHSKNTHKEKKKQSRAAAIKDAIDFLIKSHKAPISAREVMYGSIKPIPSHFCVLWGFKSSVLISHHYRRAETVTLNIPAVSGIISHYVP